MNQEDLFQAIGSVEDTVLQKAERKNLYRWKQLAAAAACFLILISGIFHLLSFTYINGRKAHSGRISWITDDPVSDNYMQDNLHSGVVQSMGLSFFDRFAWQMSIEARVKKVLPDIYVYPSGQTNAQQLRLLLLEVKDTIVGENMPSEIYYMMPTTLSTDLEQYDTLIMTVSQLALESATLLNASKKRMESFQWLFYAGDYDPSWGGVVAYKDGKMDPSLWELEGWGGHPTIKEYYLSGELPDQNPFRVDKSVQQVKNAILEIRKEYKDHYWGKLPEVKVLSENELYDWEEAQKTLKYMKDKAFSQKLTGVNRNGRWYVRIINGLPSNEAVLFNPTTQTVSHSEVKFTWKDLLRLPPLEKMLKNAHTMDPPEFAGNEDCQFCFAKGEYYKSGKEVFGILWVYWRYQGSMIRRVILIRQDGTQIETTAQEVMDLIKEYAT